MPVALLQTAIAQNAPSAVSGIGPWIGVAVGTITVVAGAFKLGSLAQRIDSFEHVVVRKIDEFMTASLAARQDYYGWKATTESRLGRVEQDQESDKQARHDLRESVNEITSDHEKRLGVLEGDRRNGPDDRRRHA